MPSGDNPKTVDKDAPSTSTGESSAEKIACYLCKNLVNAIAVISLPKILKDDSMMEVFQGHIPEVVSDCFIVNFHMFLITYLALCCQKVYQKMWLFIMVYIIINNILVQVENNHFI